ncbi:hypothetical protein D3C72_1938920 [compost metagenome]
MTLMLRQPWIIHRLDQRLGTEVLGQKLSARLLLAKTQSQSLDAPDDEIRRKRIQRGPIDFAVMANLRHQMLGAAHHAAEYITMTGQEFGRAVHNHINT